MKTRNFLLSLLIVTGVAISAATAQQASFTHISMTTVNARTMIAFTTPREANVKHYRIEASNDSIHFTAIANLPSAGNSVFPRNYNYDITAWSYKYYRVGIVEMSGGMPYSSIVEDREIMPDQLKPTDPQMASPGPSNTLVKQ